MKAERGMCCLAGNLRILGCARNANQQKLLQLPPDKAAGHRASLPGKNTGVEEHLGEAGAWQEATS